VDPEPEYPAGRKGLVLTNFWKQMSSETDQGLLVVDGDVVLDPEDFAAMHAACWEKPDEVHVAPVRLWPISTGLEAPIWGHGHDLYGVGFDEPITRFSLCCTYLPSALLWDCILSAGPIANLDNMHLWIYPDVDKSISKVAAKGYKVNIVENCKPKHLNF
jgi:hypothetical protein